MARQSYNLDGITIGEEIVAWGTLASSFTDSIGFINSCDVNISDVVNQKRNITGGDTGFVVDMNVDMLHTVDGSIETNPIDFKPMKFLLGTYTAPSTTYTITPSRAVKSFSLKGSYDETEALQLTGVTITKSNISLRENDLVVIRHDFFAKKEEKITATITGTAPTIEPLTFLSGSMTVNAKAYKINTADFNINFNVIGKRNIESVTSGNERLITEAIKRNLTIDFSINADLEDIDNELDIYNDGTTIQTARDDFNIVLTVKDASGNTHTMTITGNRGTSFTRGYRTDGEIKNFDFKGVSKTVTFTGVK